MSKLFHYSNRYPGLIRRNFMSSPQNLRQLRGSKQLVEDDLAEFDSGTRNRFLRF
jgi:hypothetical protein